MNLEDRPFKKEDFAEINEFRHFTKRIKAEEWPVLISAMLPAGGPRQWVLHKQEFGDNRNTLDRALGSMMGEDSGFMARWGPADIRHPLGHEYSAGFEPIDIVFPHKTVKVKLGSDTDFNKLIDSIAKNGDLTQDEAGILLLVYSQQLASATKTIMEEANSWHSNLFTPSPEPNAKENVRKLKFEVESYKEASTVFWDEARKCFGTQEIWADNWLGARARRLESIEKLKKKESVQKKG